MELTHAELLALELPGGRFHYDEADCMLYAVGIGLGADPLDRCQLDFVYEKQLKVMPSLATVIAWDDSWAEAIGLDLPNVLHGEQRLTLHHPLPPAAEITKQMRVREAYDKGPDVGAVLLIETEITEATSDTSLCTLESVVFARTDGGFGGPSGSPEALPKVPEREPDMVVTLPTLRQAALLYRLSGDRNPLHCDPDFAAEGGFDEPILHGLCTWGHACHAVVGACCDYAPEKVTGFAARFTAPVIPGETLRTEIWRDGDDAHFRSFVVERDLMVLDRGLAKLSP